MDPVTASITIGRSREDVFAYLADIANHPEFCDHYLKEWRLTRVDSVGYGAGARFRTDSRLNRFGWNDISFTEVEPPYRIVATGRGGKYNRIRTYAEWTLQPASGGTRVDYMTETEPAKVSDRLLEALRGQRGWTKRNATRMLRRLRGILEEGEGRGPRATVAAMSPSGRDGH